MRYAYGTLGGLLAGQATSNFSDPDANAETLDFGGNAGEPGHVRVAQVRYTIPAYWGGSWSFAAENPNTIIATANGTEGSDAGVIPTLTTNCPVGTTTCTTTLLTSGTTPLDVAKQTAPDFTAAWYMPQPWGHLDFSAVVRPSIDMTDGRSFSKQFVGYGGHFGIDIKPGWFGWVKDDFTAHIEGGDAIGGYVNSSSNVNIATNYGAPAGVGVPGTYGGFNGPTSAASAALIRATSVQIIGAEVGYQHWWLDNLRSNINAGWESQSGIPSKLVPANGTPGGAPASGGQAATLNKGDFHRAHQLDL